MKKLTQRMTMGLAAVAGLLMIGCGGAEGQQVQGSAQEEAGAVATDKAAYSQGSYVYIKNRTGSNMCLYAEGTTLFNGRIMVREFNCSGFVPAQGGGDGRFAWQILDSASGYTRLRNYAYNACIVVDLTNTTNGYGPLVLQDCNAVIGVSRANWISSPMYAYVGDTRVYMANAIGSVVTPTNWGLTSGNYVHDWSASARNEQDWGWLDW